MKSWIDLAIGEERKEAHKFLAGMGLYLRNNGIFRMMGECGALTRDQINEVQGLWDAEWDRLKPPIKARITAEFEAEMEAKNAQVERLRTEMEQLAHRVRVRVETAPKPERYYLHSPPDYDPERAHRNRLRGVNPELTGGFTEHHLYGPRGFKNPFKYEESPNEVWATPTILAKPGYGKAWPLSYRPSRPLTENHALSIVTAGICGDPPPGRSALERRAQ